MVERGTGYEDGAYFLVMHLCNLHIGRDKHQNMRI